MNNISLREEFKSYFEKLAFLNAPNLSKGGLDAICDFFITKFNTILQELHDDANTRPLIEKVEEKTEADRMYNLMNESMIEGFLMASSGFRADITSKFIK